MLPAWVLMMAACLLKGAASDDLRSYFTGVSSFYSLDLDLSNEAVTDFTGKAILNIKTNDHVLNHDQTDFVVNAANLQPVKLGIIYPNKRVVPVLPSKVKVSETAETWTIPGVESLQNSSLYTLEISYRGRMNSSGGLFRTTFEGQNYIGCQLYPSHGRKVFPGLDSPGNVVTTNLTLNIMYKGSTPEVITGLTPVSRQKSSSTLTTVFTSPFPTSLNGLYFTIGPYIQVTKKFAVFAPSSMKQSPTTAITALKFDAVQNLYGASGLEPVVVVVPGLPAQSDRGLGIAALSPGLVAGSESLTAVALKKQDTAVIEALVKGLFGAVVSPRTWDDTWIVESLPRYIAQTLVTQMDRWDDWKNMALPSSMISLAHSWSTKSTPVIPNFNNTSQVISYLTNPAVDKGAAIMALVESILPKEKVLKFFSAYVKDRKGYPVSTDDFFFQYSDFHQLNSSTNFPKGKTLKELILPWLTQTGYPSLILKRDDNDISATEEQFSYPDSEKVSGSNSWALPVKYSFVSMSGAINDENQTQWLLPNTNIKLATNLDNNVTVAVNGAGYRSLYDADDLSIMVKILNSDVTKVPSPVRANLLNDGLAFAKAGKLNYKHLLGMMLYLVDERDLEPWMAAAKILDDLWSLVFFKDDKIKTQFNNFAGDLLRPAYLDLGLNIQDPSMMRGMLRSIVTKTLCDNDDFVCRQDTLDIYNEYIKTGKESSIVAVDLIPTIYCNGLRDLTDAGELKTILLSKYNPAYSTDIKKNIFSYLACPSSNNTINSLLKYLLTDKINNMPNEDILLGFEEIVSRPENIDLSLSFIVENFSNLLPSFKEQDKAKLIKILGKRSSSAEHIQMLEKLAVSSSTVEQNALKDAIETAKSRQTFMNKYYYDIAYGLFGYMPVEPTSGPSPSPSPTNRTPSPTETTPNSTIPTSDAVAITSSLVLLLASLFSLLLH